MNSNLFKNKYRIPSARLKYWNYSWGAYYYVTICTKNRTCWFGNIKDGKIKLSEQGKIIKYEWLNTPKIRKNVKLDEYVIMPNHLHGIIIIDNGDDNNIKMHCRDNVETHCNASLRNTEYRNKFGPQSNNLSSILRGFKGVTKKQIHKLGFADFLWQPRFHDHIVRSEAELNRIREYIMNNPLKWEYDCNNPENFKQK